MSAHTAVTFTTDTATVAGTFPDGGGPVLDGDAALSSVVSGILSADGPDKVRVIEPNIDYVFTPGRATAADVAAAMLAAGAGRGSLNDAGWDALTHALGLPDADAGLIH